MAERKIKHDHHKLAQAEKRAGAMLLHWTIPASVIIGGIWSQGGLHF
jgi:hypothetical protein